MASSFRAPRIGDNVSVGRFAEQALGPPPEIEEAEPYGGETFMGAYGAGIREAP